MSVIGFCSGGMRRLPYLSVLLESPCRYFWLRPGREISRIVAWGRKPSADRARRIARRAGLPLIQIEDGFLRSYGLGVDGAPLHSLAVDYSGIYYDATTPSDLESLIIESHFSDRELVRADHCMGLLRQYRLSKYSHGPVREVAWPDSRPRVLVVDQTFGDASVTYGGADEQAFLAMLDRAVRDNPTAEVVVKVHPDVIAGKKRGYLLEAAERYNCRLWSEDICTWSLLHAVERVYVVTSQMGFDALLAGKPVHCFGLPFYAGWGLTEDRQTCPRRGHSRTLQQVFAAAYLRYCRYVNPYTGQRCELEDTMRLIAEQKVQYQRLQGNWLALGFSPWKRRFVPDFLGRPSGMAFAERSKKALEGRASDSQVAVWASSLPGAIAETCKKKRLRLWRLEDGFLRSVGLGSDLVRPLSLVLDAGGIYYDATSRSDLEKILSEVEFCPDLLDRAGRLRDQLVEQQLSKYNVGTQAEGRALTLPGDRVTILVPGQVESDASIAHGSPWLKTNRQLLVEVRRANPEAYVIYKPHPDVLAGGRVGALEEKADGLFDCLVTELPMPVLLEQVDEVHTLCSLTGFEALLRGVKVVTYGLPFYAGWGLTDDRLLGRSGERGPEALQELAAVGRCRKKRGRKLSLSELVAATLILYPTYVDPQSGDIVDVETAVGILRGQREALVKARSAAGWRRSMYRVVRNRFFRK
ncbi:capsular polysaccharide biosynthesis protein [Microbulbifer bruguierae]|uniref:Capsular polysaccharide biosynthesis protein n=1 Tax=Microbulbifer bruguierae TaxID=3029061 RepID=A0ABY8NDB6_9GAMM|nr:capsular polysaccharide biosynthesis protein [Microbulbifer bruguierae]WGL16404.1 capsular polysaccharide biosynthesis protein [Microbulbifer bruguierae]